MKLFNKKIDNPISPAELQKKQEIIDIKTLLNESILDIITLQKTVDFYPDGPDKEEEMRSFETSKKVFLSRIAIYDDVYQSYASFCAQKGHIIDILPSHKYIRQVVKNLIK